MLQPLAGCVSYAVSRTSRCCAILSSPGPFTGPALSRSGAGDDDPGQAVELSPNGARYVAAYRKWLGLEPADE